MNDPRIRSVSVVRPLVARARRRREDAPSFAETLGDLRPEDEDEPGDESNEQRPLAERRTSTDEGEGHLDVTA